MKVKKILFGHAGQFGDICTNIPSFDVLRKLYPDSILTININKKYQDCAPLFWNQKNVDGIFISDAYEDFPNLLDRKNLKECGFDLIFNPMINRNLVNQYPERKTPIIKEYWEGNWWKFLSQTEDVSYHFDLPICNKKIDLNQWWPQTDIDNKLIAFHATPANYNKNNDKSFKIKKAQDLVNDIKKLGLKILQVGGKEDYKLDNALRYDTDFFGSIRNILTCRLFLGGDSGLTWFLSGYNFPVLACYSNNYYKSIEKDKNDDYIPINNISSIQAVNPNSIYLDAPNVNDISNELIIEKIKKVL